MRPFEVHSTLGSITHTYPTVDDIAVASRSGGSKARLALARLWLSEGIPYAFRERPAVYDEMRFWLAARLGLDPKEISLVGSARIGQSLSPDKQGQPFGERSDLDLFAVSTSLFKEIVDDFNKWAYDYETHAVCPRHDRERRFWDDHIKRGPTVIHRGFIDADMVPLLKGYAVSVKIGQAMYLLVEKLKITPSSPSVRHASLRVFNNWGAFVRQADMSLMALRQPGVHSPAESLKGGIETKERSGREGCTLPNKTLEPTA